MTRITSLTLVSTDPAGTAAVCSALGVADRIHATGDPEPSEGYRGYGISLVTEQPGNVDALVAAAVDAGATVLQEPAKSFWGYGAIVASVDGAIWRFGTSSKKHMGAAAPEFKDLVLLLGVDDVKASKQFYAGRGFEAGRSFGGKYAEFPASGEGITLALYPRKAAAKEIGADPAGSGSHRLVIGTDGPAFTDADDYIWETAQVSV
ncbi:glyoxalase [Ruania zhangjianzhongii]|uniref:glyoxalase n=1 Tax=Ruania zhangjianzhongii TaxID=2603206 RepID=UPI0011CAEA3B|nr:glyoxalase [Ruania zhangjianzhongii]